jgi:uncharacterized Zn ribbon protein
MNGLPNCPNCHSEYAYKDGAMYVCPECEHEWAQDAVDAEIDDEIAARDANDFIGSEGGHQSQEYSYCRRRSRYRLQHCGNRFHEIEITVREEGLSAIK